MDIKINILKNNNEEIQGEVFLYFGNNYKPKSPEN